MGQQPQDPFAQYAVKDDPFAAFVASGNQPSAEKPAAPVNARRALVQEIMGGFLRSINPIEIGRDLVQMRRDKLAVDDSGALAKPSSTLGDVLDNPKGYIKSTVDALPSMVGGLGGAYLTGRGINAGGRLMTKIAPQVMDMGLKRTAADRLEFPNTPQRLVDERIIPRGNNVQNALSATEAKIGSEAAAFDAAHPIGPVDPDRIAASGQAFAHKAGKVGGLGNVPGPEAAEIDALGKKYQAQNTRSRSLTETIDQKRAYQARAKYDNRPNAPAVTNNELNFNKGVADANRSEAIRLNPAIEGDLAKERDLMGALEAQEKGAAKATPLSTVGTLKSMTFLRNPTAMGGAAIGLDRMGQMFRNPNWLRAALLGQLNGSEQPR